jgi:enoyl-CoA hydratase/carnithine racemase
MPALRIEEMDGVRIAWMSGPRGNAIGGAMLAALEDMLRSTRGALVLASDSARVFSSGFDAPEVFAYSRDQMQEFFARFTRLCGLLRRHPAPVVAALQGHVVAAGALIACGADFRVMTPEAEFRIKALDLGVVLPRSLIRLVEEAAGGSWARRLLLAGETMSAQHALSAGLAAELVSPADVLPRAVARARDLASKPPAAFAAFKRAFAEPFADDDLTPFLDFWFGGEARLRREALLEALAKR